MVTEMTLLPKSREEDWSVEKFVAKQSPLRPLEFRVGTSYAKQQRVRNSMDCVRFEFLAEMLYQETLEQFLDEWPEAEQTTVTVTNFDEAVLLKGGENVQMLLVRSGKVVYSLWVNFPVDLQGRVASLLPEW